MTMTTLAWTMQKSHCVVAMGFYVSDQRFHEPITGCGNGERLPSQLYYTGKKKRSTRDLFQSGLAFNNINNLSGIRKIGPRNYRASLLGRQRFHLDNGWLQQWCE